MICTSTLEHTSDQHVQVPHSCEHANELQVPVLQLGLPEIGQVLKLGSQAWMVKLQPFGPEMPPMTPFIDEKVSVRSVSRLIESLFVFFMTTYSPT
jgi:hypothetical protein